MHFMQLSLLFQNTSDGKLVEQESGGEDHKHRDNVGGVNVDSDEKMDSLQLEYTYLLTSQVSNTTLTIR